MEIGWMTCENLLWHCLSTWLGWCHLSMSKFSFKKETARVELPTISGFTQISFDHFIPPGKDGWVATPTSLGLSVYHGPLLFATFWAWLAICFHNEGKILNASFSFFRRCINPSWAEFARSRSGATTTWKQGALKCVWNLRANVHFVDDDDDDDDDDEEEEEEEDKDQECGLWFDPPPNACWLWALAPQSFALFAGCPVSEFSRSTSCFCFHSAFSSLLRGTSTPPATV